MIVELRDELGEQEVRLAEAELRVCSVCIVVTGSVKDEIVFMETRLSSEIDA